MKILKNQFLVMLTFLIITGCAKREVLITVEVHEQSGVNMLIHSVPISGTTYWGFADTIKQHETGKFELKLKITQPSFIIIRDESSQNRVKLLIEPGNNYQVSMQPEKNVQITGANEKGQMLYATFPDPEFVELELRKIVNLRDDTISLTFVHQKINELKQSDISKFQKLLDSGEISKSFFDLVQKDRDCYYASLKARFLLIKTYPSVRAGTKIENELLEHLKKIYNQFSPNNDGLLISSFWSEYANLYITDYHQFIQDDFDIQKIMELRNNGTYHTHIINEAKKHLTGKVLEYFQARYIHYECFQGSYKGSFEKEFILLFEQFEKDYPKSEYSKFFKPFIDKIIGYHQIIEQPFDKGMLFMDNYKAINTIEEAVKPLSGKKIYIDVWATWCGPCKVEFAHNEALKKMLAENDIQMLYISIDRAEQEQTWKNEIKYHRLVGTHIHANSELNLNLMKLFSKKEESPYISIPWYILIDEQGNIMEERAKSPSQLVAGEKMW